MRINSGLYRGRKLTISKKVNIRPSLARIRKMVFDTLLPMIKRENKLNILDIFAGSGAYGFEAMSLFGGICTFMEMEKSLCQTIREFANKLNIQNNISIYCGNALVLANKLTNNLDKTQENQNLTILDKQQKNHLYSLVFLDPPYDKEFLIGKMLKKLIAHNNINDDSLIVVETSVYKKLDFIPYDYIILKEKISASTRILILQLSTNSKSMNLSIIDEN